MEKESYFAINILIKATLKMDFSKGKEKFLYLKITGSKVLGKMENV